MKALSCLGGVAFTTLFIGAAAGPAAAQDGSFFPEHPPIGAKIQEMSGILLDYGIGMKSGGFTIGDKEQKSHAEFYTGWPMRIAGRVVTCAIPPTDKHRNEQFCKDWPDSVKLGQTYVTVHFWQDKYEGEEVSVSNQIDLRD
jgi:hypothetical protein